MSSPPLTDRLDRPRVVITGLGWVTPLGSDLETVWAAMLAGKSAIRRIERFDAGTFPTRFAAQVPEFDHLRLLSHPEVHHDVGYNCRFALAAAAHAWRHAGLHHAVDLDHDRLGVYLGSGEGSMDIEPYNAANLQAWQAETKSIHVPTWAAAARQSFHPTREIEQEPHQPLTHIAMEFNTRGPAYNCLTACAASTQAVGEAAELLREHAADVMLAGGAHTMIHPYGVTGFNRLTALSERNDEPATASRPFSRDRDGFVLGEGGGMVVLETLEHALARQAPILAEIVGYGSSADAHRITDMNPDGLGAVQAMQAALDDAELTPADIHFISAHGTGTDENDSVETKAIKRVFADRAGQIPVNSIKSMIGHLIAAAGVVELITCVLALRDRRIPPTVNLQNPDPECDLDYVPHQARSLDLLEVCLSNSFGFGGQNDTLVVRRIG